MLTEEFDRETMRYLSDILAQENTTRDELIRDLIRDRWLLLHQHTGIAARGQTSPMQGDLGQPTPPTHQAALSQAEDRSAGVTSGFNLLSRGSEPAAAKCEPGTEVLPVQRSRNPKQALADFVKRRNQRVCLF